ncbi:MAG: hypothetical protein GXP02_05805 [Alphaproteobacteria bacterium]|nr:hypothetical protein [Alphaproteobacteria bacterium]
MNVECSRLNIFPAICQAYRCLWFYKLQHIMISLVAVLPFCLAGLAGLLEPVLAVSLTTGKMPAGFNLSFAILVLTTFVWAVPMTILWHRLYLLGPENLIRRRVWPLITRSLRLILNSMIFFGMGLVVAVIVTGGGLYLRVIIGSK